MAFSRTLLERAAALLERCKQNGLMLATAESCTGGLVAALLTEVPGSSAVVDRGFVTYSNQAKIEMLGVALSTLDGRGAVSAETAIAMAEGALSRSLATLTVSITGIAGPGGGSLEKPVGLVWFGVASKRGISVSLERRFGAEASRTTIREAAVEQALALLEHHAS